MKARPFSFLLIPLLVVAAGCTKIDQSEPTITQGIYGFVFERYGDWMPGDYNPNRGERPIQREVYVYEYTTVSDLRPHLNFFNITPENIPTRFVAKTRSGKNGFYEIALPAGKYSVFLLEEGKLYAYGGDGQGGLQPAEAKAGEVRRVDLVLDHAVY